MAANTYLRVTEVDFNDIRNNLKSYLSTQTQFQDYDFEGSNMSVLLDVLSYNTHYNAFYTNMLANEMFLDTAQQRDSVVSRAKELGYLTRSARGASANVTLTFVGVANTVSRFTIPENSKFSTTIDDVSYTFVTPENFSVVNSSNTFSKAIEIIEGEPLTHKFTVSDSSPVRYILPNENVDTRSIKVRVIESSADSSNTAYTLATNIREVNSTSTVYYLQETSDKRYEVLFGSGPLGRQVNNGNIVQVDYRVCNGNLINGANTFSIDTLNVTPSYSSVSLSVNKVARGGVEQETVDDVKFNAPRNFQIQNRAIIDTDYERIILNENTDLASTIAFGGEKADPPVFGKVFIAVKPVGEQFTTAQRKLQIRTGIIDRTPLGIDPVIIDPDYLYVIPTVTTYYDKLRTTDLGSVIVSKIRTAIQNFATNNLEKFGKKLRYSRFVRALDNTGDEILNNEGSFIIQKRVSPILGQTRKLELKYNNKIRPGTLSSTQFTFDNFLAFLEDDSLGGINIFRFNDDKQKVNIKVGAGTINYETGLVEVNSFKVSSFDGIEIKISATPDVIDITPVREQIILMQSSDAIITAVGEVGQ